MQRSAALSLLLLLHGCGSDDSSPASGGTTGSGGGAGASTGGSAGSSTGGNAGSSTGGNAGSSTGGNAGSSSGGNAGTASGGAGGSAGAATCNSTIGWTQPLAVCSTTNPCTNTPPTLPATVTTSSDVPTCKTKASSSHPAFDDGPPLSYVDAQGVTRYACAFTPAGASQAKPLPLVVFFHGSFGSADDVYNFTSIREKAAAANLSGDATRPGYHLLSIGARNLHWPTSSTEDGAKHDMFHRDLASPSGNSDLANFDKWVDQAVATGLVDDKRIYTMGWSNGGRFAQLVAIARHQTPTVGGHRVAAAAVYSATDPFHNTMKSQQPSCQLSPYPKSPVAIALVGRACDLLPCDEAQGTDLTNEGLTIEPGDIMSTWQSDLQSKVGATTARLIIAGTGQIVSSCSGTALCTKGGATLNHIRWPDGIADKSNIDHEPAMLTFLRQHPLP